MAKKKPAAKQPKVKAGFKGPAGREPRARVESAQGMNPSWAFSIIDFDGPWCCTRMDQETLLEVVQRLRNLESMTWGEIEGRHHHAVEVSSLAPEAQRRLADLQLDDVDELFSLRINGPSRVWGIRVHHVLKLLWWDPRHEVCPVTK